MRFQTKRFLREEIVRLSYRIEDLENRLCPCEDHDWKVIGRHTKFHDYGVTTNVNHLKCKRCGKTKQQEEW